MKTVYSSIILLLLLTACGGGRPVRNAGGEGAVFDISESILESRPDTTVMLGKVRAGEIIRYDAWLRNVSDRPLVIIGVETSCGCTSVEYERHPIQPGEKGSFSFRFDSRGMWGAQRKMIEIRTSASTEKFRLFIMAEVLQDRY